MEFLSLQTQSTLHLHCLSFVSVWHQKIKCTCLNLDFSELDPEVKNVCVGLKVLSGEIRKGLEKAGQKKERC